MEPHLWKVTQNNLQSPSQLEPFPSSFSDLILSESVVSFLFEKVRVRSLSASQLLISPIWDLIFFGESCLLFPAEIVWLLCLFFTESAAKCLLFSSSRDISIWMGETPVGLGVDPGRVSIVFSLLSFCVVEGEEAFGEGEGAC